MEKERYLQNVELNMASQEIGTLLLEVLADIDELKNDTSTREQSIIHACVAIKMITEIVDKYIFDTGENAKAEETAFEMIEKTLDSMDILE